MSLKHTYSLSIRNDSGGTVLASTTDYSAGSEENFSETAPAGDNVEIDLKVDVSQIVSFFVVSTKDVTFNTNAVNAAGGQGFDLTANIPLWWNSDLLATAGTANPLTIDTTKLFFINDGSVDATVRGGFLVDLTA